MPRDDWAKARIRSIQRSAWKIQQDEEAERRTTQSALKDAYSKWTRKLHKSKKRKKNRKHPRAHSGRPPGPQLATVRAGRTSASTGNRGTGLREQSRKAANQQPRPSGKDGSNLQERSASPSVPENPVTQAQHPAGQWTPMALDQANFELIAVASEPANGVHW